MPALAPLLPPIALGLAGLVRAAARRRAREEAAPAGAVRDLGPGTSLSGILRCDRPLASELAGAPCLWSRTTVVRRFRDERTGARREVVVREAVRHARCRIEAAGACLVLDLSGAEVAGECVHDAEEVGFPAFWIGLGGPAFSHRRREWVLRPDAGAAVCGTVEVRDGVPTLVASRVAPVLLARSGLAARAAAWLGRLRRALSRGSPQIRSESVPMSTPTSITKPGRIVRAKPSVRLAGSR